MADRPLRVLSLCSGIGGIELGLRAAGVSARVVCYVEGEAFCVEHLAAKGEAGELDSAPVWSDLRTFDGRPWRGAVDCITAGYPCQPFSVAGKRDGRKDPRHLWPDVARVVGEALPGLCFFENVPGHLDPGYGFFEEVVPDLERLGYRVFSPSGDPTFGIFSAAEAGAPHRRERLFVLAYRGREHIKLLQRVNGPESAREGGELEDPARLRGDGPLREDGGRGRGDGEAGAGLADAEVKRCERPVSQRDSRGKPQTENRDRGGAVGDADQPRSQGRRGPVRGGPDELPAWPPGPADHAGWRAVLERWPEFAPAQPPFRGVADGLPSRVDRLRALGNAVVPVQTALAWRELTRRI